MECGVSILIISQNLGNMEKKALNLLLYALDNELTSAEQAHLDEALAASEQLQQEREELLRMRTQLANMRPLVERDEQFADRVMEKVYHNKTRSGFWSDLISLSPKVAAACVLFVVSSLLAIYFWEGNLSSEAIIGVQHLTPEDAFTIQEEKRPSKEDQPAADPKIFIEPDFKRK